MRREKNIGNVLFVFLLVLSFYSFFCAELVFGIKSPLGVDGRVYYADDSGEVFEGIPVIVTNINTSEFVVGETGLGSSGRFSFVLNWTLGHLINISVSNPFYTSYRVETLDGSIRGADLFLDMDFDNVPPEFVSSPSLEALAEHTYTYEVETFDWNNDVVSLSLVDAPINMSLNSGLVEWTPTRNDYGNHSVIINASDGESYSLQEFVLEVFVINDVPNILSVPVESVMQGERYEYEVVVVDEDFEFLEYNLFRGPEGMFFDGNVLTLVTNRSHFGEYVVIIDVKDRFGEVARQIFLLMVDVPELVRSRSSRVSADEDIGEDLFLVKEDFFIESSSVFGFSDKYDDFFIDKIVVDNNDFLTLSIRETTAFNEGVKRINTRTFKYFFVESSLVVSDEVSIFFFVSNSWLERFGFDVEDVVLVKFDGNSWVSLPTSFVENRSGNLLFESLSPGLSLFAITHKDSVVALESPVIVNKIDVSNLVLGRVVFVDEFGDDVFLGEEELSYLEERLVLTLVDKDTGDKNNASLFVLGDSLLFHENVLGNNYLLVLSYDGVVLLEEDVFLHERISEVDLFLDASIIPDLFKETLCAWFVVFGLVFLLSFFGLVFFILRRRGLSKK